MIIQAKVINVSKTFTGKSATTGKDWANKGILLGWEDEDGEQFIPITTFALFHYLTGNSLMETSHRKHGSACA